MTDHDSLIEKLGQDIKPVKQLRPVGWRLVGWMVIALPCAIAASFLVPRTMTDWSQSGALLAMIQLALAFLAGTLAIYHTLTMSIAGRHSAGWKVLSPIGILWLFLAVSNIPTHGSQLHDEDGINCFTFLLVVSIPMMILIIASLRHSRALHPIRSLAVAGFGVASLAVSLLSFCHPIHLHMLDFLMHLAAIVTIIALTIVSGKYWIKLDS